MHIVKGISYNTALCTSCNICLHFSVEYDTLQNIDAKNLLIRNLSAIFNRVCLYISIVMMYRSQLSNGCSTNIELSMQSHCKQTAVLCLKME